MWVFLVYLNGNRCLIYGLTSKFIPEHRENTLYLLLEPMNNEYLCFIVAQTVKRLPVMQETQVQSLGREDPLEKEMAIHSSILAWRIPWIEAPGRLQSTGSQRVRHNWATSLSLFQFYHFKYALSTAYFSSSDLSQLQTHLSVYSRSPVGYLTDISNLYWTPVLFLTLRSNLSANS